MKPGDCVDYVYVDNEQVNPMRRVAPTEIAHSHDHGKYAVMLLGVA